MKRISITLVLLFIIVSYSQSQSQYIGVKGGLNIPSIKSSQSHEVSKDYKSVLAASFGLLFEYRSSGHLALQVELNYSGQGGKRDGMQPIVPTSKIASALPSGTPPSTIQLLIPEGKYAYAKYKNEAVIKSLEVPVLGKFYFGSKYRFYTEFGPYIGYVVKATAVTSGKSEIYYDDISTGVRKSLAQFSILAVPFNASTDISSDLNLIYYGLTAGAGVNFKITERSLIFGDVRASYAITKLQKDTAQYGKAHLGNLLVSFGYAVKI